MRPEGDNRRLARLRQLTADPALAPATGPPPPQTPEKPASPPAPDHDHVVAGVVARLLALPRRAVVRAEDETHLNLLPHVRASWTLRGGRPEVPTPGKNRKVTVFGALEVTTGAWVYRLGRRCVADFIALLDQLLAAFPRRPGDRGDLRQRHHPPRPQGHPLPGHAPPPGIAVRRPARSLDYPVERIWGALKNYVANTAVPGPPGSGRSAHSSAPAHPMRCWIPPRPGPAHGCRRITNRISGMPLT